VCVLLHARPNAPISYSTGNRSRQLHVRAVLNYKCNFTALRAVLWPYTRCGLEWTTAQDRCILARIACSLITANIRAAKIADQLCVHGATLDCVTRVHHGNYGTSPPGHISISAIPLTKQSRALLKKKTGRLNCGVIYLTLIGFDMGTGTIKFIASFWSPISRLEQFGMINEWSFSVAVAWEHFKAA
jgi:hypothetical protein